MLPPVRSLLVWAGISGAVLCAQRPQFDPASDYGYELAPTDGRTMVVMIEPAGLQWPGAEVGEDTALLALSLTGPGDREAEIVIRAAEQDREVRQVFEAGTAGQRFLDLSAFIDLPAGTTLALSGAGVSWETGRTDLTFYDNPDLAGQRVLVLAPHPDDAEIGAFGLYRQTSAEVITVTSGDYGGRNFAEIFSDDGEHYRVKGWIRTWDSINVPFYGGVMPGQARNLGFYDGVLAQMQSTPAEVVPTRLADLPEPGYYRTFNVDEALRDRPFESTWDAMVADLCWELERVNPTIIAAPHPMLDNHADHQFTTIALIEAMADWDGDAELYLYTNHNVEEEAWPLGDRDAWTGLPSWTEGELWFDRIYSHPLTPDEQKLKLIALEAMHDLRDFHISYDIAPREGEDLAFAERYSYFRRGPRPNELFFVVSREGAQNLRKAFLADH